MTAIPEPRADLSAGDKFLFLGNDQQTQMRVITVGTVSVSGVLTFTIAMPGLDDDPIEHKAPGTHSMLYSEALVLVEQDIWLPERRAAMRGIEL